MLFFNLQLLETKTKNDIEVYQSLYNLYTGKTIRKNCRDCTLIIPDLGKGSSFLINPEGLLKTKSLNYTYTSQYIKLAGRRSYIMYKEYGITYLDLSFYPDINLNAIKANNLLKISNNTIHFKHEEK